MENITVRGTTAPVECTERPIFRRSSHDLAADTAGGADADTTPVRRRPGRQGVLFLATCLMVVAASFGTLVVSAAPASARVADPFGSSCSNGVVNTRAGVQADREVFSGGQYVSVRYYMENVYRQSYDTGYLNHFIAPKWGTTYQWESFPVRWWWGGSGDLTRAYVTVRYWDGYRWYYNPKWTELVRCIL